MLNRVGVVRDVRGHLCAVRLSENDVDVFERMTASATSNPMPMIHLPSRTATLHTQKCKEQRKINEAKRLVSKTRYSL